MISKKQVDLQYLDLTNFSFYFFINFLKMPIEQQTDEALWIALKKGDSRAFDTLFNRYWQQLFTTAYAYLDDREKCREIVHDIFLNICIKKQKLTINSFAAYVITAVRYHVYKALKTAEARHVVYAVNPEAALSKNNFNNGDEKIRYRELETVIDGQLEKLPKRCIEIYNLSRKNLLSNEEIATQLGISKRTVENQLTHALHHIRTFLSSGYWVLLITFCAWYFAKARNCW